MLEDGWTVVAAAGAFAVSTRTAYKWLARLRTEGDDGLQDRNGGTALDREQTAESLGSTWSFDRVATIA